MTQHGTGSDPWQSPYGTPPQPQPGGEQWSPTRDAPVSGAPYGSPPVYGGNEQWQSPYVAQPSMPVAPPYSQAGVGDMPLGWAQPPMEGNPGTLDLPWYGIGLIDAVKRAYMKALRFDGRASRGEYWWFILYGALVGFVVAALVSLIASWSRDGAALSVTMPLLALVSLAHIPVGLSLTIRRLHDTGSSGWMYLLCLIPYLGGLILLGMCCLGPNPTGARFDTPAARPFGTASGYPYG